jgi:aspartate kinase
MKTIVQKYGGTSVNTADNRKNIIQNAKDAINEGMRPIIVVSAMGRFPEAYATDSLLRLLPRKNPDLRSKDMIACCGEMISTAIVAEELTMAGMQAMPMTGGQAGIKVNSNFGNGDIQTIDTAVLLKLAENGVIPVVAGFQGLDENGDFVTLGRGGSDITATALGGALKSELIEIYTDVDGVMTADPNIVEKAALLNRIAYNDVFQLAEYGAKVIHPRAVKFAMEANVPVCVLNVNKGRKSDRTIISDAASIPQSKNMFCAVTSLSGCSQVEVTTNDFAKEEAMFAALAKEGISLDMINIFAEKRLFIVNTAQTPCLMEVLGVNGIDYKVTDGFTKITVLGNMICGVPGVMAQIIAVLYSNNIRVYQSSDSSSTISVLVEDEKAKTAVKLLHDSLVDIK